MMKTSPKKHLNWKGVGGAGIALALSCAIGLGIGFTRPYDGLLVVAGVGAALLLIGALLSMLVAGGKDKSDDRTDYWGRVITLAGAFMVAVGALATLDKAFREGLFVGGVVLLVGGAIYAVVRTVLFVRNKRRASRVGPANGTKSVEDERDPSTPPAPTGPWTAAFSVLALLVAGIALVVSLGRD